MATTKRKESAALFELLDKSTLKVPKNAASLKIPNWWSSRTNPAGEAGAKGGSVGVTAAGVETRIAARQAAGSGVAVAEAPVQEQETEREAEKLPVQPRLFDPPPANVAPPSSPSIRPPTIGVASPVNVVPVKIVAAPEAAIEVMGADLADAASKPAAPEASPAGLAAEASVPVVERKVEAAIEAPTTAAAVAAPVAAAGPAKATASLPVATPPASPTSAARGAGAVNKPAGSRMLVPPSHPMANKGWKAPRPGAFARLPAWAMLSAVAGLIVVICVVVFIARQMNRAGASNSVPAVRSGPPTSGPSVGLGNAGSAVRTGVPAAESRYNPDLYYVIVWSMPVPAGEAAKQRAWSTANEYVAFLGRNNIEAAVEMPTNPQRTQMWYAVVATRGFPTTTAAKEYRDKIVRLGDTLSRGVWKDANPQKGLGAVGH